MILQHKHLIIRAEVDNCPDNEDWVVEWLTNLVDVLGMNILSGPITARVDDTPGNIGITGVVIIETSHIAVHFWEETGLVQLDVYTCGTLNKWAILDELNCLEPTKVEHKFLDRESGLVELH
jgi:S-adenosylmethionine/arginine decarboxylase-like enzyme